MNLKSSNNGGCGSQFSLAARWTDSNRNERTDPIKLDIKGTSFSFLFWIFCRNFTEVAPVWQRRFDSIFFCCPERGGHARLIFLMKWNQLLVIFKNGPVFFLPIFEVFEVDFQAFVEWFWTFLLFCHFWSALKQLKRIGDSFGCLR